MTTYVYFGALESHMERLNEGRSSAKDLKSRLESFHKIMGNWSLKKITREVIRDYATELGYKGNSPATINAKLCALKAALKEAYQMGWIDKVPEVKLEKIREKVKPVISDAEVEQLKEHAGLTTRPMIIFYLKTGCRANELIEAVTTWDCLHGNNLKIMHTKNGCVRIIEMDSECKRALLDLKRQHEAFTFSYKHLYKLWNDLIATMKWQDKGYTLHTLRHTVITRLAKAGIPVQDIQKFIGHKSIDTTMKYVHAEVDHNSIMSVL